METIGWIGIFHTQLKAELQVNLMFISDVTILIKL